MSHYHFDRPLELAAPRRGGRIWEAARLVAASAAGAALTLVVLAVLRGMPPAPAGDASPTPQPSESVAALPTAPATAPPGGPTAEEAGVGCLSLEPDGVVDDWLEPGEDPAAVAARIADLPLVLRDDRATGSVLVFADDRFVVGCEWAAGASAPEGIFRGVREPAVDPSVKLLFAFSERDGAEPPSPGFVGDQVSVGATRDDVARVLVVLEDGVRVEASVGGGLWLAWWREPVDAATLRAYDASGALLDESPADPTTP
jgi:hypothetical protein